MTARTLIVVDTESTGLIPGKHVPIEIAAIHCDTGEELYIAPAVEPSAWSRADPAALAINRYFERRVFDHIAPREAESHMADILATWLYGNTLAGANPRFDHDMLDLFFARNEIDTWEPRHRLADLSAYAAGVLGLDPTDLPGLSGVCAELGVASGDHTALGDARATQVCFTTLAGIVTDRKNTGAAS